MIKLVGFTIVPLATLLGSALYTLVVAYRLRDWRPVLFAAVLLVMSVHQGNEVLVFHTQGISSALAGFGEYPETTANLLASAATVLLLRLVERERTLAEELEERVRERTEELESFTYSVSHDLRTPLRAVDGYTQLLQKEHADPLDEEGRRLLNLVSENAQKMGRLIDDLLTLSRLGRREMSWSSLDMEALVREAYEELCQTPPDRCDDVTLRVHSLPNALGDPSMIRQVFSNLLSNALKFTRQEATPHIEVGFSSRDSSPAFYVRDNGVGFDPEQADALFGLFERIHDQEDFEGTGVGLALVERILRRHDGQVWAEGQTGEGATIYFTLPDSVETNDE